MISPAGTKAAVPPTFCSHRPVCTPTMFIPTASHIPTSVTGSTYVHRSPSPLSPAPNAQGAMDATKMQQAGIVEDVVDPVAPAAEETVALAEGAPGPAVDAALLGIARREMGDREPLRHEEEQPGEHPEHEAARAGGRRRGEPPDAHHGDDVEEDDVPQRERAGERRRGGRRGRSSAARSSLEVEPLGIEHVAEEPERVG